MKKARRPAGLLLGAIAANGAGYMFDHHFPIGRWGA
jgi:hypothetical protein